MGVEGLQTYLGGRNMGAIDREAVLLRYLPSMWEWRASWGTWEAG